MSFVRLQPDDFVVSSDAISSICWTTGSPALTSFYTSSTQVNGSSGNYYINVFDTPTTSSVQFAIAYGNAAGSGSANYNNLVDGKSPTATIFGQWQDLVIGDENTNFVFGNITSSEFFALPIERACYKESIFLGSLTLTIKNPLNASSGSISLTDNSSLYTTGNGLAVQFTEAGRVFQLVSGSAGTINTSLDSNGYTLTSGSYGWLLPDIGAIILNPLALSAPTASGGLGFAYSGSASATGSIVTSPNTSLFSAISASGYFQLNSQETITSDFVFVRPRSSEFNYSENPSFISGSTGEVLYSNFINNPQTYITTIGLYNDSNELLAVAKLSRPLSKNFTKEALVRVKLDF
jgi:hypothetical protein